ncbi:MAG: hypothetical protein JWL62_3797 [Hyphomicrobiales bacterium]|jgi:hypothetical protein|nr:hypothetical protein [Hyphomicrobiales bacterium]
MASDDAEGLLDQLSYAEAAFLVTATKTNVLAFQPREDPMIARLLDLGFLDSEPDADPSHEMLIISEKGQRIWRRSERAERSARYN